MPSTEFTQSELADKYLDVLPYEPYPVQEEAILEWFTGDEGILVCAPTGMGKTLIAHAALFEALHRNKIAYYTTPLIALTDQKFYELQKEAVRWGFSADDVGLITGNRKVNPNARILVVVAEILLNRLLNPGAFDFSSVSAVIMDEFHSFNDPERGIVWELTLGLLPEHIRLMLLSATVGNATAFLGWLSRSHNRRLKLIYDDKRLVPLTYEWVADKFLSDQLEVMAEGTEADRRTPALVFCFNREECWSVAEQLKGLDLLNETSRKQLHAELESLDWTKGAGPKLKQILWRGIGVHHAGMLPRYRRIVEELYGKKLLSVAICTETLAAGINLPARSVLLTALLKGPFGKKKLIGASTAHQIFGRAGRPQFDDHGFVYALAHEDDVRILKWKQKYDTIPDGTRDPNLIQAKKALLKKKPTRRENEQYWTQPQFQNLIAAPPTPLESTGNIPWRLLAYLLMKSPEVNRLRSFVRKRLMDPPKIKGAETSLDRMLLTLHAGGFVTLDPPPPAESPATQESKPVAPTEPSAGSRMLDQSRVVGLGPKPKSADTQEDDRPPAYQPVLANPTEKLERVLAFRSVHPIYGLFLLDHLGVADRAERIQAFESLLELPRQLLRSVRVPAPDIMPVGPLGQRLETELIARGLVVARVPGTEEDEDEDEEEYRPPTLAEKLRMLFDELYPSVGDVHTESIWCAGELLLRFDGDFDRYVKTYNLIKQEGLVFRHLLRLILLCGELADFCPAETTTEEWQLDLREIADRLTESCRKVDPQSTEKAIVAAGAADVVEGEEHLHHASPLPTLQEIEEKARDKHWDELAGELSSDSGID